MVRFGYPDEVPDDLFIAARVTGLYDNEVFGRWRLRRFTVTEEQYGLAMLRHKLMGGDPARSEMAAAREVPPGEYTSLQRRMTEVELHHTLEEHADEIAFLMEVRDWTRQKAEDEFLPVERRWVPVMSDTPAEIMEHAHALAYARGRVLITGLGLGCLPHALLSLDDVTAIDIIEIDPDVIALTGTDLTNDERVTIHEASALDIPTLFPKGTRFDYVWHDIWSRIADDNLDDATAEHGISYARLVKLTLGHLDVGDVQCWAWPQALEVARISKEERKEELEFQARMREMPLTEQIDATLDRLYADKWHVTLPPPGNPQRDQILAVLDPDGAMREHLTKVLSEPDFWEKFDKHQAELKPGAPSMPNAHLDDPDGVAAERGLRPHLDNEGYEIHDA